MKEQILAKIEKMYDEYMRHYSELEINLEEGKENICPNSYDDLFYSYNGESISHMLDVYDEKMDTLRTLKLFIEKIEE